MTVGPLTGFTIGVTADRRSEEQMQLLRGRGADCMHGRTIRTHALGPETALRDATEEVIKRPTPIVVFTTGIGVRGWLEAAEAMGLAEPLREVLEQADLYTRGPKANGATVTAGLYGTYNAPSARSEEVIQELASRGVEGVRVGVQLDGAPGAHMQKQVEALGAEVVPVPVYRWSLPEDTAPAERLVRAIVEHRVDAVTFTARPAVENLFVLAGNMGLYDQVVAAFGDAVLASCVGETCAGPLSDLEGVEPLIPPRHRLGAQVQQLSTHFAALRRHLILASVPVMVQGRAVVVNGAKEPTMLPDREAQLLSVLAERPGVVYSKSDLLSRIWGPDERDDHVVEVTLGRLRNRLGAAGLGVETVIKRGYRLSES